MNKPNFRQFNQNYNNNYYNSNYQEDKYYNKNINNVNNNFNNNFNKNINSYDENNNFNYNFNNKFIINYIYNNIELSNYKYKIIEYESDLNILLNQKHYVSANFTGTNCFMIFTKNKDKYISSIIEKKQLTYNKEQVNYDNVKIYPCNIRLDKSVYNGTIIDGIFFINKRTKEKYFIITDVFMFCGENFENDFLDNKLLIIDTFLNKTLVKDKYINNINIIVNKLYEISDIQTLLEDIEKSKGFETKGIVFYPEKSGVKVIFLNNTNTPTITSSPTQIPTQLESEIIQKKLDNNISIPKNKIIKFVAISNNTIYATFEMRKTELVDVYNLYYIEKNNNITILKKLCIAYLPDIKVSILCKNIMESKKSGRALVKCIFNDEKGKWIPTEEDNNAKLPINIIELKNRVEIIIDEEN
jgi:hypothetical protein